MIGSVTSVQSTIETIGTVLAGAGGASGAVYLLRKMQKDYLNTASERNQQLEEEIGRLNGVEIKYRAAQLDRMELCRLLEGSGEPIPVAIQRRVDNDSEGL